MTKPLGVRYTCLSNDLQKTITDNNIDAEDYTQVTGDIPPRKKQNIEAYHFTIRNIGS